MSRARGTYSTVENWVLDVAPTLKGVTGWVLLKIATQANYKRKTVTIGQLMDALAYDARTLNKACAFLVQEGYVLCTDGEHVLRGACTPLAQAVNKARTSLADGNAPQTVETGNYPAITSHNKKEEEGIQKEGNKDLKDPPTPQGGEAQDSTAPVVIAEAEDGQGGEQPEQRTPDGEAADAATAPSSAPVQDGPQFPANAEKTDATGKKKVPRRRAAPDFDPLTLALPDCVPADIWAEWVAHRADIRKPLTQAAAVLTVRGLETAHANAWDVADAVHEAITGRWTGCVFDKHRQPNPRPAHVVQFPTRRDYAGAANDAAPAPRRTYE